jgi:hypothetical protein
MLAWHELKGEVKESQTKLDKLRSPQNIDLIKHRQQQDVNNRKRTYQG